MAGMRVGGLASGMDIDSIVKDLMKAERIPLDKLSQKKQILQWQRDDYRSMNKLLDEMDRFIFDGIGRQGTFSKKTVTSTDPNAVTATATGSSANMTSSIKVTQLATARNWVSDGTGPASGKTLLKDLDPSIGDVVLRVQKPGSAAFETNTVTIKLDPAVDTVESFAKKLSEAGAGLSAFFDDSTGKFVLSNNVTGAGSNVSLENDSAAVLFQKLGFSSVTGTPPTGPQVLGGTDNGQNAKFDLNGLTNMERTTNTFTISGVTYTLKAPTISTVSISSATDTNGIFDSIKGFVDKYNDVIDKINKKTSESRYRDYQPLTTEQRKDLSEKEAEMWEEKSKSGMLRGDQILNAGLLSLRQEFSAKVNTGYPEYDQMSKIGITTTANYLDKGKLQIDETKLKKAIEENPDAVMKLFAQTGTDPADKGAASRLRDSIGKIVDKIELKAGNALRTNAQFTIGKELMDVDKKISSFEDRLVKVEDRYWRQFSAMETAIQRANSQSAYLMQQFSGQ
ncbi:flagellar hook-associated protein 2 [Fictibacillus aquaticus]|uniref:Flagellar hook-associated protein 2 n=1 Tax=Fictibacillus aquaticus TaxID=2021314 RepID=A0A235FFF2_9BACL|nr:flagellar hook-associated protein 2 [Fictibacillus aquaticus]OYD59723.1 hypothetical protein CGZ90_07535 [Fictibacillus aquaticus]